MEISSATSSDMKWYRVADCGQPAEGERLHVRVEHRYVTIFKHKNKLSAIDSICHHAGGPLTMGPLQDIEELGNMRVVLCPWHRFMVSIDGGLKAYKSVDIINGVPTASGWKVGKTVQRPHAIRENADGIYLVSDKWI